MTNQKDTIEQVKSHYKSGNDDYNLGYFERAAQTYHQALQLIETLEIMASWIRFIHVERVCRLPSCSRRPSHTTWNIQVVSPVIEYLMIGTNVFITWIW